MLRHHSNGAYLRWSLWRCATEGKAHSKRTRMCVLVHFTPRQTVKIATFRAFEARTCIVLTIRSYCLNVIRIVYIFTRPAIFTTAAKAAMPASRGICGLRVYTRQYVFCAAPQKHKSCSGATSQHRRAEQKNTNTHTHAREQKSEADHNSSHINIGARMVGIWQRSKWNRYTSNGGSQRKPIYPTNELEDRFARRKKEHKQNWKNKRSSLKMEGDGALPGLMMGEVRRNETILSEKETN